jgi:hypothetical protein
MLDARWGKFMRGYFGDLDLQDFIGKKKVVFLATKPKEAGT